MDKIVVQVVYGPQHIRHIEEVLMPRLAAASQYPVVLVSICYDGHSNRRIQSGRFHGVDVVDVPNDSGSVTGFARNHNVLFGYAKPKDSFVVLNPDCVPIPGTIDQLLKVHDRGGVAIVEGRQWPFEHPKEYDKRGLDTPWASGAFSLIDSSFYQSVGGMDEEYFLYTEDVDLSWRAWLTGWRVLYCPQAPIIHYSGGPFYRPDLLSNEECFSLRNFIVIARKFFGEAGQEKAIRLLKSHSNAEAVERALERYLAMSPVKEFHPKRRHPMVKILGVNRFHKLRTSS